MIAVMFQQAFYETRPLEVFRQVEVSSFSILQKVDLYAPVTRFRHFIWILSRLIGLCIPKRVSL